jgi:branched-chain amino acid transport system permease protein
VTLFLQAIILGVLTGGVYALMTSGLTLSFGTMRVINLAQGAFVILGSYLSWTLFTSAGIDPFLSILITTPVMFLLGAVLQMLLLRPIRYNAHSLSLIMTWVMAIAIEGALAVIYTTDPRAIITSYANNTWVLGGFLFPEVRVFGFGLSIVLLVLLYLILGRTRFGRAVRATSQRETSARLLGVDTDRVSAIAFGIGCATAGAAGAVYGLIYSFYPDSHYDLIGRLLAIVVLGGLGSYRGAFIGALALGVCEAVVQALISPEWSSMPFYILLALVLIMRPQGLFGLRERGAA